MTETNPSEPLFSAVGVVTADGTQLYSPSFEFGLSGIHLIMHRADDGGFRVDTGPKVESGRARFEKTCMQPVTFLVMRDGKPYHKVEVKALLDAMNLRLVTD